MVLILSVAFTVKTTLVAEPVQTLLVKVPSETDMLASLTSLPVKVMEVMALGAVMVIVWFL